MPHLRDATNPDGPAIMALIDRVYREYGDRLCLDGADSDLHDIDANYFQIGGHFVVLDDDAIRGTFAIYPAENSQVGVLRRLYLDPELRGTDWGTRMMNWAIEWAKDHGMRRLELWSDTRFTRAHSFFARFGFQKGGHRTMTDGHEPYHEHFFSLDLEDD